MRAHYTGNTGKQPERGAQEQADSDRTAAGFEQQPGFGEVAQDLRRDFAGRLRSVEDADAVGFACGEFEIPAADRFKKRFGLPLDPVRVLVPGAHAGDSRGAVEIEEKCHVRETDADREGVDPGGHLRRDHPGNPLIDGRGIEKPVGDHGASRSEGGTDHFPDELGAACGEEEEFGFGRQRRAVGGMLEEVADHLAGWSSARLPHQQSLLPA